mmetsp:Transcript_108398/g.315187  ORF Transcript_108398/g.315187 Transcript_108398/m.315187 type:complete len:335 (-) Transcript_108398:207-1211(-)
MRGESEVESEVESERKTLTTRPYLDEVCHHVQAGDQQQDARKQPHPSPCLDHLHVVQEGERRVRISIIVRCPIHRHAHRPRTTRRDGDHAVGHPTVQGVRDAHPRRYRARHGQRSLGRPLKQVDNGVALDLGFLHGLAIHEDFAAVDKPLPIDFAAGVALYGHFQLGDAPPQRHVRHLPRFPLNIEELDDLEHWLVRQPGRRAGLGSGARGSSGGAGSVGGRSTGDRDRRCRGVGIGGHGDAARELYLLGLGRQLPLLQPHRLILLSLPRKQRRHLAVCCASTASCSGAKGGAVCRKLLNGLDRSSSEGGIVLVCREACLADGGGTSSSFAFCQ